MKKVLLAAAALSFAFVAAAPGLCESTQTVILAERVFTGREFVENVAIIVDRGVILDVVSASDYAPIGGARVIDAKGMTVTPGFVDSHVHVLGLPLEILKSTAQRGWGRLAEESISQVPGNREQLLKCGITTVIDMGSTVTGMLSLEKGLRSGKLLGPRLYYCGPLFTAPNGHPAGTIYRGQHELVDNATVQVETPGPALAKVDRLAGQGVSFIKLVYDDGTNYGKKADPKAARYATPTLPGATTQQARVRNQILSVGVLHEAKFSEQLRQVFSIFGSRVNFGNIAIANIEDKTENNLGLRTYFELSGEKRTPLVWQWDAGLEAQQTQAKISNYGNVKGLRDTLQAANRLYVKQYFFFTRFHAEIFDRLTLEAAISMNNFQYKFGPLQSAIALTSRKFNPQFMPRLALSYKIINNIYARATVSRGFSPPTIDEIRSSNNVVNTELQPENGLNYETGIRLRSKNDRFWLDALVFNYHLRDAIVRRLNLDNTEYFVNVGGTKQLGLESSLSAWIIEPRNSGFIYGLQLHNSFTFSKFTFTNYLQASNDYSGNKLTGVPDQVVITNISITFPAGIYLFAQHNYTARIPLNDANSVFSNDYNLVQIKAGWRVKTLTNYDLEFYGGLDNLLNEKYSLGNDLNAMGGRYYNPSPTRNFFGGIKVAF